MRTTFRKKIVPLLLIGATILCSPGCGPELVPIVIVGLTISSMAVTTIQGMQQIDQANLDRELKQLQLKGLKNGQPVTTLTTLTNDQVRQIQSSGRVKVNGTSYPVSVQK